MGPSWVAKYPGGFDVDESSDSSDDFSYAEESDGVCVVKLLNNCGNSSAWLPLELGGDVYSERK